MIRALALILVALVPLGSVAQDRDSSVEDRLRRLEQRQESMENELRAKDARIRELEERLKQADTAVAGAARTENAKQAKAPEQDKGGSPKNRVRLKTAKKEEVALPGSTAAGEAEEPPVLILGACNVLTGRLHKFSSYLEPIRLEHLLASACVPTIFPAVTIDDMAYWDGLFSDNPPISSLTEAEFVGLHNIPNEIWVIKINPTTADEAPVRPADILDRRNELAGNISLFHGLNQIERINGFLMEGAFTGEFLTKADTKEPIKIPKPFPDTPDAPYHIPRIEMSADLAKSLTYESKLDRRPEHIARLIEDGEMQGKRFLDARVSQISMRKPD